MISVPTTKKQKKQQQQEQIKEHTIYESRVIQKTKNFIYFLLDSAGSGACSEEGLIGHRGGRGETEGQ